MKSTIAAIDFGTCKIVTLVAETSGTQRCDIIGAGISAYDGFLEGEWNNTMLLNEAIQKSITEAETQSKRKIREINVGVPGEFTRVDAVETSVTIQGADPRVTAMWKRFLPRRTSSCPLCAAWWCTAAPPGLWWTAAKKRWSLWA